ncbi:MAG TPA: oligosaccharide flippase family protein [Longimicrobiales bacterium]|nr:oligosaccharide flippase family protein [Longimicrobiales bacterium]
MSRARTVDDPSRLSIGHRLRFLAKDSLLYGGAAAFNKAFALVTFPILARHFSVEDYGLIDFFTVLASLFTILMVFGQDTAVARFFYDEDETASRRRVISQSLSFQLLVLAVILPLAWVASDRIGTWLNPAPESRLLLKLVLLQVPCLVLINFAQNILKWTFARARFLTVSIGSTTVSVLGILTAIAAFDLSVVGVIAIYLVTQAVFGLLGLWFVRHWLVRPRDWQYVRPMLIFAIPYGIVCTVGAAVPALERTLIVEFLGSRELGLFAAGAKVAMLIGLPITAFQIAWGPFSLAIYKTEDADRTYNWVLKLFSVVILAAVMVLTALSEIVIHVLAGSAYAGASIVVFGLSLGLALEATGWITAIGINLSKRSYLNLYAYATFLAVSLTAMMALLPFFGLAGIAWGALLGYAAKTVVESWLAQRAYPLPWAYEGTVRLGLLTMSAGLASQIVSGTIGRAAGGLVAAAGALAVLAYGWTSVLNAHDRLLIVQAAGSVRGRRFFR